jgi:hypothetical protein
MDASAISYESEIKHLCRYGRISYQLWISNRIDKDITHIYIYVKSFYYKCNIVTSFSQVSSMAQKYFTCVAFQWQDIQRLNMEKRIGKPLKC